MPDKFQPEHHGARLAPEAFSAATEVVAVYLKPTGTNQYLVSNMVGDFIRVTEDD